MVREAAPVSSRTVPPRPAAASRQAEWRSVALLWLGALAVWALYYWSCRITAIQTWDSLDYAQIARHIAAGHGFQTSVLPLGGLEWMRQTGRLGGEWWNVHRFPLPSLIEAGLFRILGPTDFAVTLFSAIFFFANIPLVFAFARRMFPYRVALLAAGLYAFTSNQLAESVCGATEPASVFFFLTAVYLVLWKRTPRAVALAGALTGLAYLNRASTVLYLVPMALLAMRCGRPRPWRSVLVFLVPAGLVILPWLVRNALLTGEPLFNLTTAMMARFATAASPRASDWSQFAYIAPSRFWRAHPGWAFAKWRTVTAYLWSHVDSIGGVGQALIFFLASVLKHYDGTADRLRRWLLVVLAAHVLVLGLLAQLPRYYAIFVPFLFMYGADGFFWLWDALRVRIRPINAAVAVVLVLPALYQSVTGSIGPPATTREKNPYAEYSLDNLHWIEAHTQPDALVLSDAMWSVAWYANRRSVAIPPTPAAMGVYAGYRLRPDGIYLKAVEDARDEVPASWIEWARVQTRHLPVPGYRLVKVFEDNALYYERSPVSAAPQPARARRR